MCQNGRHSQTSQRSSRGAGPSHGWPSLVRNSHLPRVLSPLTSLVSESANLAEELARVCGSKLVAMTNGGNDSVLANGSEVSALYLSRSIVLLIYNM